MQWLHAALAAVDAEAAEYCCAHYCNVISGVTTPRGTRQDIKKALEH